MKTTTSEILRWSVGIVFGAGIAYATLSNATQQIRQHEDHLIRHDSEFQKLHEDIGYLRSGMDILLGRRRKP